MNIEPKEPYIYQPYGMQDKEHWKEGRIYAIAGISELSTIKGLLKREAAAILSALKGDKSAALASLREENYEFEKRLKQAEWSLDTETKARIDLTDECASLRARLASAEGRERKLLDKVNELQGRLIKVEGEP